MSHAISVSSLPTVIPDNEVKPEWRESVSNARMAVTMATPLFAYKMYQCEIHFTLDISTAAATVVAGKNLIYINPLFFDFKLTNDKQRAFVLLHEVDHIFLMHIGRQTDMGYHPELWNVATDYFINLHGSGTYKAKDGSIKTDTKYTKYLERPSFVLYDERFAGMDSDEIYHLLLEENDGDADAAAAAHGGGGRPMDDDASGQMPLDSVGEEHPDNAQISRNQRTTAAAVAKAEAEKTIGDCEGDIVTMLTEMFKPKISWKDQLATVVETSSKERNTYNRVSRRSQGDILFPSKTGQTINVVFGIDSSGSMSQLDYQDGAGELYGVLEDFESWTLDLVSCDVRAHSIGQYASEDDDTFQDMRLEMVGGGGTDMTSIVEYAQDKYDEGEEVNACIIITDGYLPPIQHDTDDFEVIVVVTTNGNRNLTLDNARVLYMSDMG